MFIGVLGTQLIFPSCTLSLHCEPFVQEPFSWESPLPGLGGSAGITAPAPAQDPSGQLPVGPHLHKFLRLELLDLRDQVHFGLNISEVKI